MWNIRVVSSISSVSLPEKLCLNGKTYNILNKIEDGYMNKKKRDKNRIP